MTDTKQYEDHLKALKEVLIKDLQTIAVLHEDTDDWEILNDDNELEADENVQADNSEAVEERIATLAELETRYRNVVRALKKIEAGTYGVCEISGEAIEPERLEVNPAARTCIAHREDEGLLPL